jgi:hypothetical protein
LLVWCLTYTAAVSGCSCILFFVVIRSSCAATISVKGDPRCKKRIPPEGVNDIYQKAGDLQKVGHRILTSQ